MNSSHVATTGGVTAMVADVLIYATHWPLQPLDAATATSIAGLLIVVGAGIMHFWSKQSDATPPPP